MGARSGSTARRGAGATAVARGRPRAGWRSPRASRRPRSPPIWRRRGSSPGLRSSPPWCCWPVARPVVARAPLWRLLGLGMAALGRRAGRGRGDLRRGPRRRAACPASADGPQLAGLLVIGAAMVIMALRAHAAATTGSRASTPPSSASAPAWCWRPSCGRSCGDADARRRRRHARHRRRRSWPRSWSAPPCGSRSPARPAWPPGASPSRRCSGWPWARRCSARRSSQLTGRRSGPRRRGAVRRRGPRAGGRRHPPLGHADHRARARPRPRPVPRPPGAC